MEEDGGTWEALSSACSPTLHWQRERGGGGGQGARCTAALALPCSTRLWPWLCKLAASGREEAGAVLGALWPHCEAGGCLGPHLKVNEAEVVHNGLPREVEGLGCRAGRGVRKEEH